jgi:hypothetical protein
MYSGIKSFTVTIPDNLRWMMVQKPLSFIRFDVRQKMFPTSELLLLCGDLVQNLATSVLRKIRKTSQTQNILRPDFFLSTIAVVVVGKAKRMGLHLRKKRENGAQQNLSFFIFISIKTRSQLCEQNYKL